MYFNFATTLSDAARLRPDKPFVVTWDETHTFAELERRAGRAAAVLASRGVTEGSRIGLRLPNVVDFVPYYFALLARGATVLPMNPAATAREVGHIVDDAGVDAVITLPTDPLEPEPPAPLWSLDTLVAEEEAHPAPLTPVAVRNDATAVVLYTSGSTGVPKGVELSHLNLLLTPLLGDATAPGDESDVLYAVLPLYHVFGLSELLNGGVLRRQTLVLRERFSVADLLDAIERHRITDLFGVPTMYHALVNADLDGRDLTSVTAATSGGAPMAPEQIRLIREALPNADYVEGYGLTETGGGGTANGGAFGFRHGSVGRAVVGADIRVVDGDGRDLPPGPDHVGEVLFGGPLVMKGYLGRPEETAETVRDGWLRTGDLGRLDEDGYLYIVGRSKELIIRGGLNVYPNEIEAVLLEHPKVSLAAVVGRPDDHYGEEVVAFVVPEEGQSPFSAADLVEYAGSRLAPYKLPRQVLVKGSLPVGPTGKIDKRALAAELREM
ncbi:class I adenylate-forming enzyme family protein [Streptomyces ipomoeae]|uniref:class I adenylate-forming enzyme family protein n=1 Tax=Streptomyces ipomoeae TaxID=103232 RepID=UPI00114654B9|nr:AMP-binding protein [Streptomyces ipomoeae]MDX2937930.1 AMP-binding protein [Streptomyces ipomoeae]TQE18307.1 long-chain fatty acid--CoA ligase [Streptomyces ipomoeae]